MFRTTIKNKKYIYNLGKQQFLQIYFTYIHITWFSFTAYVVTVVSFAVPRISCSLKSEMKILDFLIVHFKIVS